MGDVYTNPPQSRNEAILNSIVEGTEYTAPPQSRIEDLLLEVKEVIEEGGHDESATRASIAPTESDAAHASKRIEIGEQFYLSDDKLYTTTSTISQGDAIVVYPTAGYNCKLSDSVTGQIADIENAVGYTSPNLIGTIIDNTSINANGVVNSSNTDFISTDYIPVIVGKKYEFKAYHLTTVNNVTYRLHGYDSNGDWVMQLGYVTASVAGKISIAVMIPANIASIRISISKHTENYRFGLKSLDERVTAVEEGKTDTTVIGNVEDGATASQAYAVGEHFIRGGKFCTAIASIASGATFTLNTNYVEGAAGDYISKHYFKTITVAAGSYTEIVIPVISNYTPLVASCGTAGTGASNEFDYAFNVNPESRLLTNVKVHNRGTTDARTWTVEIFVTYVKKDTLVRETI